MLISREFVRSWVILAENNLFSENVARNSFSFDWKPSRLDWVHGVYILGDEFFSWCWWHPYISQLNY